METIIVPILVIIIGAYWSFEVDLNHIELGLVLLLAICLRYVRFAWIERIEQAGTRLANRRALCIALAFFAPILMRVAVLPWAPVPDPWIPDEFSHLLIADTLAHGRLVNPMHPLWMHFESIHILTRPVYASVYFPGLGIVMALGKLLGSPWIGILLSSGAMCAALLWMAYGLFPPRWALLVGALAVLRWGTLSYWVNGYWGGTVTACGGALILGAYLRIRRRPSIPLGLTLGCGVVWLLYTRPLEGAFFCLPVAAALAWHFFRTRRWSGLARMAVPAAAVVALGAIGLGIYCRAITGNPLVMPYRLNQAQYSWPLTLPWEKLPPPVYRHANLQLYYEWERCVQANKTWPMPMIEYSTIYLGPLWRFYLGPALTIPLLIAWRKWWRDRRVRVPLECVAASMAVGAVIVAYPHYIAAAAGAVLALTVQAIRHTRVESRRKSRWGLAWSRAAVAACVFMLPVRAFVDSTGSPPEPGRHTYSAMGSGEGAIRGHLLRRLEAMPGRHVVFVQYHRNQYATTEWIYNEADIDGARIVWAQDMGPEMNQEVLRYFSDRRAWFVNADDAPYRLRPYSPLLAHLVTLPFDQAVCVARPGVRSKRWRVSW
jgi:hypothetical protein